MALDLLNTVATNNGSETTVNISGIPTIPSDSEQAQKIIQAIRAMMPGQTIQGELIQKEGNNIQLLLTNDIILNTKLDSDLSLNMGQIMTFEVKGNKNGQMVLRPLFENVAQDPNAVRALEAASIKVNDKTLEMVNELMKESMPVNKDMLAHINRQMNAFPDADISDIVLLNKMDLPVNQSTLEQIHLYQNNNQWMLENLSDFTEQISQLIDEVSVQDSVKGEELLQQLTALFTEVESTTETILPQPETVIAQTEIPEEQKKPNEAVNREPANPVKENLSIHEAGEKETPVMKENIPVKLQQTISDIPQQTFAAHQKGELVKNLLSLIKNEMLMKPEQLSEEGYVRKYYNKMHDITDKLESLIKDIGKSDSSFGKTVTHLRTNIEFINQVNEAYHYIQLPLKLNERQANGELYVYSRRKAKTMEDGKLTALLHLSMEHLGNMDIFLSLDQDRLNTKFCLEKEEMLDFVESHMDELNARLQKKGYVTDTSVSLMERKEPDIIHTIMGEEPQARILSKQSFDARA